MGLVNFPPLGHTITRGTAFYMSDKCVCLNVCAAMVCVDQGEKWGCPEIKETIQRWVPAQRPASPLIKNANVPLLCFDVGRTMVAALVGGRYRETM